MRRWLAAAALAGIAALFLVQLDHGLWIPEETTALEADPLDGPRYGDAAPSGATAAGPSAPSVSPSGSAPAAAARSRSRSSPWLDTVVERVAIAIAPSPRGARTGHAVLALAALLAVGFAARGLHRRSTSRSDPGDGEAGWIAAALLVASPAFVLAGRSVAGGISAVAPVALATWGLLAFRAEPRRNAAIAAAVGIVMAVGGIGIVGALVPLAATVAAGPRALREHRAEVPIAWILTAAIALLAGLVGIAIAAIVGGRLLPEGGGIAASVALGLLPIALVLPLCAPRGELLVHAVAWTIPALVWPGDPWLRLAPAAPLAMFVALGGDAPRTRALAVVGALATLAIAGLAALAFQREPARLVAAHLSDPATLVDAALHFGRAGWTLIAIAAVACAAIAVPRPVLRGGDGPGSRTTRLAALAVALAALAMLAWTAALHAVPAVSARRSIEPLVAAAADRGAPVEAALGVPAHRVAFSSVRTLADVDEAIAFLDGACRSVVVPVADLVDLRRARRDDFVVLAATDRFAVATGCARLLGGPNADPLRDVLLDRLPPRWGKPADAAFDGLRLRAVKMPDRIARGLHAVDAAFAFEVTGPVSPGDRVSLHIDGCKRSVGQTQQLAVPPGRLRPGDVVVHRVRVPLDELGPCRYKVGISWGTGAPSAVVKAFELR